MDHDKLKELEVLRKENEELKEKIKGMKEGVLVESMNDMKDELKKIEKKWQKKMRAQKILTKLFKDQCWKFSVNIDSYHKVMEERIDTDEFMECEDLYSFCQKAQEEFETLEGSEAKVYELCIDGKCGGCSFTFCQVHDHSRCACGDPECL